MPIRFDRRHGDGSYSFFQGAHPNHSRTTVALRHDGWGGKPVLTIEAGGEDYSEITVTITGIVLDRIFEELASANWSGSIKPERLEDIKETRDAEAEADIEAKDRRHAWHLEEHRRKEAERQQEEQLRSELEIRARLRYLRRQRSTINTRHPDVLPEKQLKRYVEINAEIACLLYSNRRAAP